MSQGQDPAGLCDDAVEALRRRTAELEILCDTIQDLTSTLAVEEVIGRLLERTLLHLDAEVASVLQLDADGVLRIVSAQGLPEEVVATTVLAPGEGISGFVLEQGRSLLIRDIEQDERFRRRNHERYYTASCVSAPLYVAGAPRGVINVNNKRSRLAFDHDDLSLLEAIAGHAASALHNAQRFEDALAQARCDALTGLANHGFFWSTLEREISRSDRHARPLSLALVDIDHFKQYNDRYGHLEGDCALVAVAQSLMQYTRAHDMVARYGGEEFAVILPETDADGALSFAQKMCEFVADSTLGHRQRADITVSVGVASWPRDGEEARDLVSSADGRLYEAKAMGRNCVCSGTEL